MAVVFIHSSGLGPRQWTHARANLGGTAPALLGYDGGWSSGQDLDLDDELNAILPLLNADTDLVGHSYGGFIALQLARRVPVRSVVVWEPVTLSLLTTRRTAVERRLLDTETTTARWMAEFLGFWQVDWHTMTAAQQAPFLRNGAKVRAEVAALIRDQTTAAEYAEIQPPVLVLSGSATVPVADDMCAILCRALPNVARVRVADCGHMGPLSQRAALLTELRKFWARCGA